MNTYNHKSNYTGDILTNITFRYIQLYIHRNNVIVHVYEHL